MLERNRTANNKHDKTERNENKVCGTSRVPMINSNSNRNAQYTYHLVHCTNEPNVSIPQLANLLIERSQTTNWVVVYKALVTVHHMMCYGNERFTQFLASSNSTFQLSNFLDKSGVQVSQNRNQDESSDDEINLQAIREKILSKR
ncbi:hypothetical protein NQ317_005869 [Molorchus minor]|uniref:ENTH domain-containing protein n=1 Tax=Molorchus minor TaxID=1323400 RepID=A0ABQ9IWF8_9CUCU|nr:hypothetical protein NQ317_005869 [Molorchus minor]